MIRRPPRSTLFPSPPLFRSWWLHRHGYRVTVVETAPALRPGGQAVDFRGEQVKLLKAMGIFDDVRRYETAMGDQTLLGLDARDRKSTRLNSSHSQISYAVFC